jgi:hypothetical protein
LSILKSTAENSPASGDLAVELSGGSRVSLTPASYAWGGGVNTHLHLFCARRDPTDNKWYFIDPYGIYASGSCYPAFNTPVNSPCARYPVMWNGGKAQYP